MPAPGVAREATPADLADPATWAGAEIVLLGEVHDNPAHHANQAAAVAALAPAAVVWEMLTPAGAASVDLSLDPEALGEALGWEEAGWPDFAMYAPIFAAAADAEHLGAALTPDGLRTAAEVGAAEILGAGAASLGLDAPYPPARQAEVEALMDEAHCNMLPADMLPGMVEVQRARDGALALAALAALERTGGPVAVILGNGHATAEGVPALIAAARPETRLRALGQFEAPTEDAPFDLWAVAEPAPRGDPCEAFR